MTLRLSRFGNAFTGETGVGQLMRDIGEANAAAKSSGTVIHALGGGNPGSIPAVEKILSASLADVARHPDDFRSIVAGYDSPQGDQEFIAATAQVLRTECAWDVGPENLMITNGSQSAFFMIFNMLAGRHDDGSFKHILLPLTPEYIGYTDAGVDGEIFRSTAPIIQQLEDHQFKYRIDFDALSVGDDTAAICLSRPTNPTGNVATDNEVATLKSLASESGIPLIIDSAYGSPFPNIVFTETSPIWDENCVVCLSLSKIGLAGVRTGIVVANAEFIEAMTSMNAILNLASGSFGPGLTRKLMQSGEIVKMSQDHVAPFYQNRMQQALGWLHEYLVDLPWRVHKPEGAFFLWLWFPELPVNSQQLYERLKSRGVLVIAGHHFFPGLADTDWPHRYECIRMTYSQNAESVRLGIQIIAETVREYYASA